MHIFNIVVVTINILLGIYGYLTEENKRVKQVILWAVCGWTVGLLNLLV